MLHKIHFMPVKKWPGHQFLTFLKVILWMSGSNTIKQLILGVFSKRESLPNKLKIPIILILLFSFIVPL